MILSSQQVQQAVRLLQAEGRVKQARRPEPAVQAGGKDKVVLSSEARELSALRARLAQIPDVREERVAALREALRQGTYRVSPEEIADKMIARSLVDRLR